MAGTQNLQNTAAQYQQTEEKDNNIENEDQQQQPTLKEDFTRAPNSQSNDRLNSDPFDQRVSSPTESPENQIQHMTREAGDGQNDNGNDNIE